MTDRAPRTQRQRQPRRQGRATAAPAAPAASVGDDNEGIDLDITLNDSRLEQVADSTRRPEIEPTDAIGTQFEPFHVPDRDFQVLELPVSPLKLFQYFLPVWLVEKWVDYTNNNPAAVDPDDPALSQYSRKKAWKPTDVSEIYIWIGMSIYMDLFPVKTVRDYWKEPQAGQNAPSHRISRYMSFNRFSLLKTRLRLDDPSTIELNMPSPYSKINEWANVIMDAAVSIVIVGSIIGVDEAMVAFQGRSRDIVTIKSKPTPTGLKIWVLAVKGYVLQWLWHRPGSQYGPIGIEQQGKSRTTRKPADNAPAAPAASGDTLPPLNPTQAVVVALVKRLPADTYHVYVDNLFSSPNLFLALRQLGIGATGTCRTNCGLYRRLVDLKGDDRKGQRLWPWGQLESWATPDNKVNQIAWKDNALVLFLSTYYTGNETVVCKRKRPKGLQPYSTSIKRFFGDEAVKEVSLPAIAFDYNLYMNAVDRADHLRANMKTQHRQRRGPARALAWTFLLKTAITNSFILQRDGKPAWKPFRSLSEWQETLSDDICKTYFKDYRQTETSRKRYRPGDEFTPISQHKWVDRGKRGRCKGCLGHRLTPRTKSHQRPRKRQALEPLDMNSFNEAPRTERPEPLPAKWTKMGCEQCNVPICIEGKCWYIYHEPIY